jgi:hypothetical protein
LPLHGHKKAKFIAAVTFIPVLALADSGIVRVDGLTSGLNGDTFRAQINDWLPATGKRVALDRDPFHACGPEKPLSLCCAQ